MNFTVANFNVENLILPGIRYYDRLLCTQEEYDAKANWIARTLNRIRPDIVGIQEVWSEEALHDIIGRCPHFAEGANVCAPGASREDNVVGHLAKRPRLGLVSKFPISNAEAIASFPKSVSLTIPLRIDGGHVVPVPVGILQFQRPVLKAQVLVQNTKITVFVAHLKSKGPMIAEGEDGDDPFQFALGQARATFVRSAEAAALRHLILSEMALTKTPVIVLGDMNDTPESASTQIVCGQAPSPNSNHQEKTSLWDVVLYSTFRIASQRSSHIFTHIFNGERDILDHILVSEEFYSRNRHRIGTVVRHAVLNDHLRDELDTPKPPGASDHGIPYAEISLLSTEPDTKA